MAQRQRTTDNRQRITDNRQRGEAEFMKRETIIFTACGFLLGLTLGSFVIGPKIASSKLTGAPVVAGAEEVWTGAGSAIRWAR